MKNRKKEEVLHVWTMGVAPYANETYQSNFRQNSFFIGNDTVREAINKALPISPRSFSRRFLDCFIASWFPSMWP
jgi:hypothetical protein